MAGHLALLEVFRTADQLCKCSHTDTGENVSHFFGDTVEEVHHALGRADKLGAELLVLRRHAHRARVEVTLPDIDAAERDKGCGAEVELLSAENRRLHDVVPGAHAAVGPEGDPIAE